MKKSTMKQSTLCNLMAGISVFFAIAILVSVIFTTVLFTVVNNLSKAQIQINNNLRILVTKVNYGKDMVRSYVQEGDSRFLNMYNDAQSAEITVDSTLKKIKVLVADPKGQEQVNGVVAQIEIMDSLQKQAIELVTANKLEEAHDVAFGKDYGMAIDGLGGAIEALEKGMDFGIGKLLVTQSSRITILGVSIMVLCILLISTQIATAMITNKKVIAPIIKLKDSMISMNKGLLSGSADVTVNTTEIGELAGAMYAMRSRIDEYIREISYVLQCISQKNMQVEISKEYVGDFTSIQSSLRLIIDSLSASFASIGRSTDGISVSSERVSNTAQALAHGATIQASSVEQLSASINEITEQLRSTATNAESAKALAGMSESNLDVSSQQMAHMVQAISEISDSSTQISKIIKTIEDIAFQTNILALNAAVEAARAGAAGKGFAVVADEVRSLATKSSEAAKQTNVLIENSVKSVQSGVEIADKTANALAEVVKSSQTMAELVAKISLASTEQAAAISQINQGVDQISAVVQTNSNTSDQSAEISQDLANQVRDMKNLVGTFKIKQI